MFHFRSFGYLYKDREMAAPLLSPTTGFNSWRIKVLAPATSSPHKNYTPLMMTLPPPDSSLWYGRGHSMGG